MKKLITYLKTLWSRVADSQSTDVSFDCRLTVGSPSFHRRSTMLKLCTVLVLVLTIGVGNAWADYTITFKTSGTENLINSGSTYASSTETAYVTGTASGVQFGSNSKGGNILLTMTASGQIKASKITLNGYCKPSSNGGSCKCTYTYTDNTSSYTTVTATTTATATDVTLDGTKTLKSIKLESTGSKKKFYITGVTVVAAGASKTLSSIAITTQPTTRAYLVGETFSKTGAVVTASYSDSSTDDVSASVTWTPTTGLAAGSNTITASYTEGGVTRTTTTTVTGYAVTVQKKDETGATIADAGVSASASGRSLTASAGATKYVFKTWKFGTASGTSIASAGSASTSLTGTPTAAVTVIAEFYKPVTVTWNKNGSVYETTTVARGSKPVFPDNPSSCDATSTAFYGWATSTWENTVDNLAGKTVYTSAGDMPDVTTPVTYNAVFAKATAGATSWTKENSSISAGDVIILVNETASKELSGVGLISTTSCGLASDYVTTPAGTFPLTVETGNGGKNFSFKNGTNYLSWSSGNSLITSATKDNASSWTVNNPASGNFTFSNVGTTDRKLQYNSGSPRFCCYTSSQTVFQIYKRTTSYTYSKYLTTCCTDPGLAYTPATETKTYGASAFTKSLTNTHGVAVTYALSSVSPAGCVSINSSTGEVTINAAGSATVTASSVAQTVDAVSYCADEASYTLTVNKANISPTLTYTPNSVAVGEDSSAPTVGGNPGGGGVTYAITSATPSGCATINTSTGVVTGVAVGSVTVTATVAATTNYNGGTATANVTITAASGYCISAFNSSNNGITSGFSNGGSGNEYTLSYTIPGKDGSSNWPQYWIGENEAWASFSANALFAEMHFTHSDATLGLAEGATGKLHIWDDNKASGSNLWVKFEPDGYGFRWGGAGEWDQAANTKAFTVDPGNANTYWTEIVTLDGTNNTSWSYYVGLQSASGYVYSGVDNEGSDNRGVSRTRSVTTMKVSNGTAGSYKATYLNSEATGTRGKFRIWDNNISDHNFVCHFVPYYRVTYNGSGASGSTAASADVCCEGNAAARTVVAAANGFTVPTGKSFGGWASSPENAAAGVVAYAAGADVVLTSSITLYAIWTDINYTVTVNQNPSVGATTTGQTSTAHYGGTINLTTTVPSGYRFVNWTTSDGFSITNSTSATTASFTMPNKSVTVTANFQQTHTVDWYVGGSAPANKIGDDGQTTVVDHGGKIEDFPATTPDGSACDKEFVGWTNTSSYVHGTSPLFNDVAGSPTINADASFYAVFATGGGDDFELVTAVSQLHVGDVVTIANFAGNSESGAVIKAYNSGNNWPEASASTDASGKISGSTTDMQTFTLEEGSVDDTWAFNDGTGYPYAASSNKNYMWRETTKSANSSFEITIDGTSHAAAFVAQGTNTRNTMRYNSGSSIFSCYDPVNSQSDIYIYRKPSATGHTITCADCGTSVTPTYTASPTGGTVSVTKNAAAVASGSTVKTCTSQDLTVILTPATHYDLTGFTATGLTTGTATITPAVGSTLPVSVAQTFTVTVSAGATGTLTLAPTFTAQTPLSITLETHSKGTFTPIGDIYSGESFTFPTVTPSDAECSSFLGWIEGTTWSGDGTETDPTAITGLANYHAAGSSSGTLTTTKTYTAVFGEKDTQVIPAYQKVTSAPSNWSGDYLIIRDANSRAFDGSLSTLDAADNYIGVTISEGSITANSTVNASKWTIAKVGATSNYTIKSASGYYIGRTASSNGLNSSTSEAYTNTLSYSDDHVVITSSGGPTLQMNSGTRFRYYTTSQQALQLYKYNPDAEVVSYTYTTNPACTPRYRVTISSATGGSPEADKTYEHADETITITANPAAGYSFTSWTITKTTGGDNVTSTLLTGDKPTTANTTFTMPAYDITIAATYTKKMVSTLEVKDGATVISTTTGPVSGTVNISTGANKTLDVVITPSDAYDHSWTATVSAGSTYASITNVTDDGFRVNGLAQGDATITVNAPNDGSAKSVTLTVQVRDIMPEEIILKRDGSNTPIETLIMFYDETNSKGQYVKVNVGYSPANPTNKAFTFSSALTGKVGSHSHAPASGYEVLVANGVTSDAVNCTFTSSADGSVTKVLAVTVLPILSDRFVDYVHGNATQTVSARLSDDRYSIIPDINTPSLSDASDANPTSEDCETSHYHLVGWLPQTTAEALWAAGTPITDATEGLVRAGESVEATGQTWCAIWAEEQ